MKRYRKLALILSTVLIATMFASCKKKNEGITFPINPNGSTYMPEYISLPEEVKEIQSPTIYDGVLYFLQKSKNGYSINWINIDGTGLTMFEGYELDTDSKYASVLKPVSNEEVWLAENHKEQYT